jgi:hypothetical protein
LRDIEHRHRERPETNQEILEWRFPYSFESMRKKYLAKNLKEIGVTGAADKAQPPHRTFRRQDEDCMQGRGACRHARIDGRLFSHDDGAPTFLLPPPSPPRSRNAVRAVARVFAFLTLLRVWQSMDMNRRAVVKSAALGAAVAAPKLANAFECSPSEIDPETGACPVPKNDVDKPKVTLAPMIQIMDHRGCTRPKKEYKGKASGDSNDDMCVCVCAWVPSHRLATIFLSGKRGLYRCC